MTNEFFGHIAHRHIAALKRESRQNHDAFRVPPCSAPKLMHALPLKTHPSWVWP